MRKFLLAAIAVAMTPGLAMAQMGPAPMHSNAPVMHQQAVHQQVTYDRAEAGQDRRAVRADRREMRRHHMMREHRRHWRQHHRQLERQHYRQWKRHHHHAV